MPWYHVILPLALVCLYHASFATYNTLFPQESTLHSAPVLMNTKPCQPASYKNAYAYFKGKHIPDNAPTGLDKDKWMSFLNNNPNDKIRGHTVSYLKTSEENAVKAVCSTKGGKRYEGNLCISDKMFTFTTVRSFLDNNGKIDQIKSIFSETKHLILACDKVVNQCLPVHFEGNPYSDGPDPNAKGCGV